METILSLLDAAVHVMPSFPRIGSGTHYTPEWSEHTACMNSLPSGLSAMVREIAADILRV